MKEYKLKARITFTEEVLGLSSANPEIHAEFIASKAPDAPSMEEEIAALGVEAVEEKGMTIFPKLEDGMPFLWDYQIKGFFKGVCGFLRRVPGTEASKIKAYKQVLGGLLYVEPRKVPLVFDGEIGKCQRPLRAETAQGARIALASSETVPAGTQIEITVVTETEELQAFVREALDFGRRNGISQWHNSGKGRFTWEEIE